MRGVERAERKLVADVAPAQLAFERGIDPFACQVTEFERRDQWGRIQQRDEADRERAFVRVVGRSA
jgi:hypothetical protein